MSRLRKRRQGKTNVSRLRKARLEDDHESEYDHDSNGNADNIKDDTVSDSPVEDMRVTQDEISPAKSLQSSHSTANNAHCSTPRASITSFQKSTVPR